MFGVVASSGLVLGSLVGARVKLPERVLAFMLAFASGALMTALAFELFEHSYRKSGAWVAGAGFVAGAVVFVAVSAWLDRRVAADAPGPPPPKVEKEFATPEPAEAHPAAATGTGFALLAAVTLDGVPENIALGVTLADGGSLTLLLAIFASNFPEALVGSAAMQSGGRSARFAVGIWLIAAVVLAVAVVVGKILFPPSEPHAVSIPLAIAGGAVIASLADTLMPEAYEGGGPLVALATTGGFLVSYVLSTL